MEREGGFQVGPTLSAKFSYLTSLCLYINDSIYVFVKTNIRIRCLKDRKVTTV